MKTEILSKALLVSAEPQQLPEGEPVYMIIRVAAPVANAGVVFLVSKSETSGYGVAAGQYLDLRISDLAKLFYIGTAGDKLHILTEIKDLEEQRRLKIEKRKEETYGTLGINTPRPV